MGLGVSWLLAERGQQRPGRLVERAAGIGMADVVLKGQDGGGGSGIRQAGRLAVEKAQAVEVKLGGRQGLRRHLGAAVAIEEARWKRVAGCEQVQSTGARKRAGQAAIAAGDALQAFVVGVEAPGPAGKRSAVLVDQFQVDFQTDFGDEGRIDIVFTGKASLARVGNGFG